MIVQTAPAARLSVGEIFGDPPATSPAKVVAALHALGFDYVFDTTFGADITARVEAQELADRIRADGPWPMFTSCCPGWLILVEKKYPHLRPLLSRSKSPMMMLATLIRLWMRKQGMERKKYFVCGIFPCTAKKEEIMRDDLKDENGNYDMDCVLTAREMGELVKEAGLDWASLPGPHKKTYDPPFNVSSGGAALFPVSGGVTEAALRVAYSIFTKDVPNDPDRSLYEAVRKLPSAPGEWVSSEVQMTPDRKHKRPIESLVIQGSRAIQQFLEEQGMDSVDTCRQQGKSNVFVECMACPGGCIGGGGQPHSLDKDIVKKRRAAVHKIDRESEFISATDAQETLDLEALTGISTEDELREYMEYEPPTPEEIHAMYQTGESIHRKHHKAFSATSKTNSFDDGSDHERSGSYEFSYSSALGSGSENSQTFTGGSTTSSFMGDVAILYGSQAGFTASTAKKLYNLLNDELPVEISIHGMDHFNFDSLKQVKTVILLTSTWESDVGLMPQNAVRFWRLLKSQPVTSLGSLFSNMSFCVCGFGSPKYRHFCGFATQLADMFISLGATPILDTYKVDAESSDRGVKSYNQWARDLISVLRSPVVPSPKYILVPSITPGGKSAPLSTPPGYQIATVNNVLSYKKMIGEDDYFYVELDTGKQYVDPPPNNYIYIIPRNPSSAVENLINLIYPGMLNTPISLLSSHTQASEYYIKEYFPSHITIRQLFECYIDLSRRPSLWFIEQMETLVDETESSLRDVIGDSEAFAAWAADKDYFQVLRIYKDAVPSIEVLITMLPPMLPRAYTPLLQENTSTTANTISFLLRKIPGGLCSNFLSGLKKGEKIVYRVGPSEFSRPNDALLQPFYNIISANTRKSMGDKPDDAQVNMEPKNVVSLDKLPLTLSTDRLFSNLDKKPAVDEEVTMTLTISNPTKEKYRFVFNTIETPKYRLSFEPASGIVKPKFAAEVKAILVIFCTCIIRDTVPIIVSNTSKRSDDGTVSAKLGLEVESKLSSKIDYNELKFGDKIGSGSFGTVFRGEWRGQDVAIKVIRPDIESETDFQNECDMLQELRCQYIVNFIGFCTFGDKRCLLTEFMELGSLLRYIHEDLSNEYRVKVALDVSKGMQFLNACGLIHRDLKPGNILIASLDANQHATAKIADFGTSKEVTSGSGIERNNTAAVGTPLYMAPEVLDGERYTVSADVFSFAILLLELFTAVEPYDPDTFKSPFHIAQFVTSGKRLTIPSKVPSPIADLITHCWDHDPKSRPGFDQISETLSKLRGLKTPSGKDKEKKKKDKDKDKDKDKEKKEKKHHKHRGDD